MKKDVEIYPNVLIEYKIKKIEHVGISYRPSHFDNLYMNKDIKEFRNVINKLIKPQSNCFKCGKYANAEHHIISNLMGIHPTKQRILEYFTIPLCNRCHSSNGGYFHNIHNIHYKEFTINYKELVDNKYEEILKLLMEIDQLSIKYELDLAKRMIMKIKGIKLLEE